MKTWDIHICSAPVAMERTCWLCWDQTDLQLRRTMHPASGQKICFSCMLTQVQGERCFSVWHQPAHSSWQGSHPAASHSVSLCSLSHLISAPGRGLQCPSLCLSVCVCMFKLRSKSVTEEEPITPTADYRGKTMTSAQRTAILPQISWSLLTAPGEVPGHYRGWAWEGAVIAHTTRKPIVWVAFK